MLWSSKILRIGPSRFCWSWGDLKIYCVTSLLMFKWFKILALLVQLDSPLPYALRPCWLSLWLQKCYAFFWIPNSFVSACVYFILYILIFVIYLFTLICQLYLDIVWMCVSKSEVNFVKLVENLHPIMFLKTFFPHC